MVKRYSEADFKRLERLGLKLGIPIPFVFLKLEVEKEGKILDHYEGRSRTWNRNFYNANLMMITAQAGVATNFGAGYLSLKQTSATVGAIGPGYYFINFTGLVNNSTYGIQVGIGTGAESFEGYVLGTPCVHGTGSNQLVYSAHSAITQSYDSPTKTWTITLKRIMNNNSGSAIVVAESALTWLDGNSLKVMGNRDLLGSTVTVNNGAQLTVQYAITLAFPA
jgi:hypothetical protein